MAKAYETGMPRDLDLTGSFIVRLTALDPTSGSVVAGITVSSLVVMVADLAANLPSGGGFTVTPLLTFTPGVT